jgi:hypothetical protein
VAHELRRLSKIPGIVHKYVNALIVFERSGCKGNLRGL